MADELKVGIFWWVDGILVTDAVPLAAAEPYGAAVQYGGHWEFHERLQPATTAQAQLRDLDYEHFPRGRVVHFPARGLTAVYIDRCLNNRTGREAIVAAFALSGEVRFAWDSHYTCASCSRQRVGEF